jgi:hypothetical protein
MRYTSGSWKKFLLAAVSALSLLPSVAVAQDAKGKFTLAREVRWGTAVLPAGEYSYTIERHAAGTVMLHALSGGPSAIVLPNSSSIVGANSASRLTLTQYGGGWFVTSMTLGGDGEVLYFTPHITSAPPQEAKAAAKIAEVSRNPTP